MSERADDETTRVDFGVVDDSGTGDGIRVTGWALDPDRRYTPYAKVEIWVDVTPYPQFDATAWRADLATEYPWWWGNHGFNRVVSVGSGPNNVCAYAVNTADQGNNAFIGCVLVP